MAIGEAQSSEGSSDSYVSSAPFLSPLTFEGPGSQTPTPTFSWNISSACRPLLTTFNYLSSKLAIHGVHICLVVTTSRPELLPAWPMGIHTQHILAKLLQRADEKYSIDICWLRALRDLCKPIEPNETFEKHRAMSYLIHRSLVQRDIIYFGDGLTVVAVDCIYTFKSLLADLVAEKSIPLFRDDCKESCVELLRHVNSIYKDIVLSKPYLRRAYTNFSLDEGVLEEVCDAYQTKYGSEGAIDLPALPFEDRKATHREPQLTAVRDRLQESPRKLPERARENKRRSTAQALRADLPGAQSVHTASLASPFQYDPSFTRAPEPCVERPKSPKSSLFESPRSPPITPPRSARLRTISKSTDLRAACVVDDRSKTLPAMPDAPNLEIVSTAPPRKKKATVPWLGLSRSTSNASTKTAIKTSLEMQRAPSFSRSRARGYSGETTSRSSSMSRSIKPLISRYGFSNPLSKITSRLPDSESQQEMTKDPQRTPGLRAADSRFGWLQVAKKRNACAMNAGQRVL